MSTADGSPANAVTVKILEKDYLVACPEDERIALEEAARYLDEKMKASRDGGKLLGSERIAVMTALNIAHEVLELKRQEALHTGSVNDGMRRMAGKIELALGRLDEEEPVD